MPTDKDQPGNDDQPQKTSKGISDDGQFSEQLNTDFPLSGAETDEDLDRALGLDDEDQEEEEEDD